MTNRKWFIILITAVVISVVPDLLPKVWVELQESDKIRYLGSLVKYGRPCFEKFFGAECKVEYNIPSHLLAFNGANKKGVLGLGYFLTDYAIKCDEQIIYQPSFGDSPSLLIDSYKIYKTIDLSSVKCSFQSDLKVLALNTPGMTSYGQISSNAVIGERNYVTALKRTIEFLGAGIYVLFGLVLLFSAFELNVLLKPLIRLKYSESYELHYSSLGWATFALFKSGLFDILFLAPTSVNVLFRIQSALSLFCHAGTLILSADGLGLKKRTRTIFLMALLSLYIPFSITSAFNRYLVYSIITLAILRLIQLPFLKTKNYLLLGFSICALIECLKALQINPLPTGSVTLAYIVATQVARAIDSIRSAGLLASVNIWSRDAALRATESPSMHWLLSSFLEQIPAEQVSFFELEPSGNHELYTIEKSKRSVTENQPRYLNEVPIGVSHILTTGQYLIHSDATEPSFYQIFKREPNAELGKYYSMFPIQNGKNFIGVISITKYSFEPKNSQYLAERLQSFIPALTEAVALTTERRNVQTSDDRFAKLTIVLNKVESSGPYESAAALLENLLKLLYEDFGWRGFFGEYNSSTTLLDIAAQTYDFKAGKVLMSIKWVMQAENKRAPGTLALFQGIDVIVPDRTWIKNTISANTERLLDESNAQSLLIVPVRRPSAQGSEVYGILWLSAEKLGTFDRTFKQCSRLLTESLEAMIYQIMHAAIERTISRGQLRPDVQERIMKGEDPIEPGVGVLITVDLAKSTALSKVLGRAGWEEFQREFVSHAVSLGKKYDLRAEMVIWDAVFFTSPVVVSESDLFSFSKSFLEITSELILKYKAENLYDDVKRTARVCATYGDITCKVTRGMWSVNGDMIAFMTKFESSIKEQPFALAVSQELYDRWLRVQYLQKHQINEKILFVSTYEHFDGHVY